MAAVARPPRERPGRLEANRLTDGTRGHFLAQDVRRGSHEESREGVVA
jgi:hypothetical protein